MTIYYHGGARGRARGAFLLPPSTTGAPSLSQYGAAGVHRTDRVYITTSFEAALLYAAANRKGLVYEVEPLGELEHDPDCTVPGLSFQCERARVLRVIKPHPRQLQAATAALLHDVKEARNG
ncbi:NAD(+)--rifampin ADP-ribosyltransferase [[Pseudomonas] boreopolis]